jgi:hypothetical protein
MKKNKNILVIASLLATLVATKIFLIKKGKEKKFYKKT